MKRSIFMAVCFLGSAFAHAETCKDRFASEAWPGDRLQSLYSCKRIQTVVGKPEYGYDRLCFGIIQTQFNQHQSIWYKTERYNENNEGGYSTIVTQDSSGHVQDGSIHQKGDQLIIRSTGHTSGTTGEKWIEETVLNSKNEKDLSFNTYRKGFLSQKLTGSDLYLCEREL